MIKISFLIIWIVASIFGCVAQENDDGIKFAVLLEQSDKKPIVVAEISQNPTKLSKKIDGIKVDISVMNLKGQTRISILKKSRKYNYNT